MTLTLNGEPREVQGVRTLADLLTKLELPATGFVAELNGSVLERDQYPIVVLNDGDRVELVRFVGGG